MSLWHFFLRWFKGPGAMAGWFFDLAWLIWDLCCNYKQLLQYRQMLRQKWGWLRESDVGLFWIMVVGDETLWKIGSGLLSRLGQTKCPWLWRMHVIQQIHIEGLLWSKQWRELPKTPILAEFTKTVISKGIYSFIYSFSYLISYMWSTFSLPAQKSRVYKEGSALSLT